MTNELNESIKAIADNYGLEHQLIKLQEECGELWGAVHEYVKSGYEMPDCKHLIEEIADVRVMIYQVEYLMKIEDDVYLEMKAKTDRQLDRMETESNGKHTVENTKSD